MQHKPRTILLSLVFSVVLANVLLIVSTRDRPLALPPPPNPNGYADFIMASAMLTGDVANAQALDQDHLRALVTTNAECRRLLRLGLSRQCALAEGSSMASGPEMAEHVKVLHRLAVLLVAEGRLREIDDNVSGALQCYVDAIRLGNEMSRGGFVVHRLVGCACEALGCIQLNRLVPTLDPKEAKWLIANLEKIDSATVKWDEVRRNEYKFHLYQRKQFNLVALARTWWKARPEMQVGQR